MDKNQNGDFGRGINDSKNGTLTFKKDPKSTKLGMLGLLHDTCGPSPRNKVPQI